MAETFCQELATLIVAFFPLGAEYPFDRAAPSLPTPIM
jgi:hypothetical protein